MPAGMGFALLQMLSASAHSLPACGNERGATDLGGGRWRPVFVLAGFHLLWRPDRGGRRVQEAFIRSDRTRRRRLRALERDRGSCGAAFG